MSISRFDWTRRDLAKLGALGIASRIATPLFAQSAQKQTGYAIIGLGRIADIFMRGAKNSPNSKITALVSGHRDKALKYAAQYGVPESSIYSYEEFDKIAANKEIDAVYVALPNSMHAEYTIRAAKAGKHVLCEKPMALNPAEAEQMIAACKAAKVKLMIAYRCQYEALHLKAIDLIKSGAIGEVQLIEAGFGFNEVKGEWRLDKKMAGGGPMVDVGIYCLNATRYLTGEEPAGFQAYTSVRDHDGRFDTVEENCTWTTKFPSGILATCTTTYGGMLNGFFKVHGSKGFIEMSPAFDYDRLHLQAVSFGSGGFNRIDTPSTERQPYQFMNEANHFSDCVQNNREPKTGGEEGLRDLRYIAEIYKAASKS